MNPPTPSSHSSTSAPSAPPGIAELAQRSQWVCHNAYAQNGRGSKGPASRRRPRKRKLHPIPPPGRRTVRRSRPASAGWEPEWASSSPTPTRMSASISTVRRRRPYSRALGAEIIDGCASYTEFSPSRKGVHIIVRGKLPPAGRHSISVNPVRVEAYERGRYSTMTGWIIQERETIQDRQPSLDWLHGRYLSPDDDGQLNTLPAEQPASSNRRSARRG